MKPALSARHGADAVICGLLVDSPAVSRCSSVVSRLLQAPCIGCDMFQQCYHHSPVTVTVHTDAEPRPNYCRQLRQCPSSKMCLTHCSILQMFTVSVSVLAQYLPGIGLIPSFAVSHIAAVNL